MPRACSLLAVGNPGHNLWACLLVLWSSKWINTWQGMSELFQAKSEPVSTGRDPGPHQAQPAHFTDMETEVQSRRLTCPKSQSELTADLGLDHRDPSRVSHESSLLLFHLSVLPAAALLLLLKVHFRWSLLHSRVSPTLGRCHSVSVFLSHTINSKLASAWMAEVEGVGQKAGNLRVIKQCG